MWKHVYEHNIFSLSITLNKSWYDLEWKILVRIMSSTYANGDGVAWGAGAGVAGKFPVWLMLLPLGVNLQDKAPLTHYTPEFYVFLHSGLRAQEVI